MTRNGNDTQQQLLEIQPKQLKFAFELGKQNSCSVGLANNTYHYVAFKVKTTSPKSYCVRPNIGILEPKSTCEFRVILQAQKVADPGMISKDKFLIQSAAVPAETTGKDITSAMFVKDVGKYVNEVKLKVALISPSESPVVSPINGVLKQGPFSEDPVFNENAIPPLSQKVAKDVERRKLNDHVSSTAKDVEMRPKKDMVDTGESKPSESAEFEKLNDQVLGAAAEMKPQKDIVDIREPKLLSELANGEEPMMQLLNGDRLKPANDEELKLEKDAVNDSQEKAAQNDSPGAKDEESTASQAEKELKSLFVIEEMKSKLGSLEAKLNEAEVTISKLTEERRLDIQERTKLQEELGRLKSRASVKRAQSGFPLLFLVMVAFISIMVGYLLHA